MKFNAGSFVKNMGVIRLVGVLALIVALIYGVFFFGKPKFQPNEGFTTYSSYPGNTPLDALNTMSLKGDSGDCDTFPKFDGLQCNQGKADKLVDVFYGFKSSQDCEGSGLTREGGNICLDKTQRALLTTRGGNAVYDAQIGQP